MTKMQTIITSMKLITGTSCSLRSGSNPTELCRFIDSFVHKRAQIGPKIGSFSHSNIKHCGKNLFSEQEIYVDYQMVHQPMTEVSCSLHPDSRSSTLFRIHSSSIFQLNLDRPRTVQNRIKIKNKFSSGDELQSIVTLL